MDVQIEASAEMMGLDAARAGAGKIRMALEARGESFIILATGASQFNVLKALVRERGTTPLLSSPKRPRNEDYTRCHRYARRANSVST